MPAKRVWLGNDRWPSNRTCADFARDVFRLAGAGTDKEKALAFYDAMIRHFMRGPNLWVPVAGGRARSYEPLLQLTSWGHGECTYWGWVATECLTAAGLRARRVVAHDCGHCFYEVWYRGDDGHEQWHAFDPFQNWYFLNERGEVASCEELAANPLLVQDPLPGHPEPLGHHPERSGLGHRHRTADQLFIEQPMRNDRNDWNLEKGMEVTYNFMPAGPGDALFARPDAPDTSDGNIDGSHCDIPAMNRLGRIGQPKHVPYWTNYLWPTEKKLGTNEGRPVRWHGAGALRWKPLKYGASVAAEAHNARFENGCLRPTGCRHFAEVWYPLQLPFLATYIDIDYDVVGSSSDYFGLTLGSDGGRRVWRTMDLPTHAPHYGQVRNGLAQWQAGEPSVQGLREIWLRLDFFSYDKEPTLAFRALRVAVGFQHNMYLQPRLLPGANSLWLETGELGTDERLAAEWIYQVRGAEDRARLDLAEAGRVDRVVTIDAADPSDILMTGLRLTCI